MEKKCVCEFCGGELMPIGMMYSGNSRYTIYECKECYKETSRCEGLMVEMH